MYAGIAAVAFSAASLVGCGATIGGEPVPADLQCEEDELIGYNPDTPTPRDLECVHPDVFVNRYQETQAGD